MSSSMRRLCLAALLIALVVPSIHLGRAEDKASAQTKTAVAPRLGLGSPFEPGRILRGESTHRILHFTFDDGPDPRTTPALLDALDALGVKATFFFSASRFADVSERNSRARQLALEVYRRGHFIGSHSVEHKRMNVMTRAQLQDQLDRSDKLFTEIFGHRTYLFRPPWGMHNPELDRMFVERGDSMMLWNIGSADWTISDAEKLRTTFMRSLGFIERTRGIRGGIVLMHDTHQWTVDAFPKIIGDLRARNCELLRSAGEELYDIHDDLEAFRSPERETAKAALEKVLAERQRVLRQKEEARCGSLAAR